MSGNPDLILEIRHEIEARGPITFARFMELALYHPQHGYYTSGRAQIGKEGDFFTSPTVGPLFGRFLGMQFAEMWEVMGKPRPFTLLELGAHRGWLAEDVMSWARERRPDFAGAVEYRMCERVHGSGGKGQGSEKPTDDWREIESNSVVGCIFSNELIDAFPVHLVRFERGEWRELFVTIKSGEFELEAGAVSFSRHPSSFILHPLPEGYTTEVHLAAVDWLGEMARILKRGFLLTIDYGYLEEEYYSPHRTAGTLLCYHAHRLNHEPLERVGEQDITAHVNFGALAGRGAALGLELTGMTDQSHFLMGIGQEEIERIISANPGKPDKLRQQLQTLLNPADMGRTFKMLAQHKGVNAPKLSGLKYGRKL